MEFKAQKAELERALYRAQGIAERKTTMPILANVLLEAGKEGLTVSAFDLEIGIQGTYAANVLAAGAAAVGARSLYDIVRAMPGTEISVKKQSNHGIALKSGSAEFKIVGMPAEEFPALPRVDKVPFVEIDPALMLSMIEKTSFAVSSDETRYNLNGVYVEPFEGGVRMVATDGHRLAMIEKEIQGDFKLKRGVIIPRKGLFELRRLLADEGASQSALGFVESSGVFKMKDLSMVMRLIDGQFPDYKQVIPKESERVIQLACAPLLDTLKRVSLLSTDRAYAVKVELEKGMLRVSANNPDLGEAHEEIPVEYAGAPLKIGFNARYLMDVLGALGTEAVRFELSDELSPGVLKPVDGDRYTAVIMPMRI